MQWFSRAAVLANAANDFAQLVLYVWAGPFYWSDDVEALLSRVWQRAIAVDDLH